MNKVAKIEETGGEVATMSEAGRVLEVITAMAANDTVQPERIGKMMDLYERILATRAKSEFTQALAELQPRLPVITERGEIKNNNGDVQSRYALYEDIIEAIGPLLAECGFAVTFRPKRDGDQQIVVGVLMHRGGHSEEAEIRLPFDNSGSKNAVQGVGSSLSYGKRYALCSLLNITSKGEDDDGHKAGVSYISKAQHGELQTLLDQIVEITGNNEAARLCEFLGVDSLATIPANLFEKARHASKAELAQHRKAKQ